MDGLVNSCSHGDLSEGRSCLNGHGGHWAFGGESVCSVGLVDGWIHMFV